MMEDVPARGCFARSVLVTSRSAEARRCLLLIAERAEYQGPPVSDHCFAREAGTGRNQTQRRQDFVLWSLKSPAQFLSVLGDFYNFQILLVAEVGQDLQEVALVCCSWVRRAKASLGDAASVGVVVTEELQSLKSISMTVNQLSVFSVQYLHF